MKFISLFAGIGGFDLALTRQGHECVWANEWDKYAAQIYDKNFSSEKKEKRVREETKEGLRSQANKGETERLAGLDGGGTGTQQHPNGSPVRQYGIDTRDIRTVPASDIPNHDLLVGGFPCQAFSIAGKRKGFDDTRGTLFFEIARILREKHPRLFILENVKGLLSHDNGNTFKTIISTLDELGYDLQWQVLNSKNFGVPQNRERVFIIGNFRGTSRPEVFPIGKNGEFFDKKQQKLIQREIQTNGQDGEQSDPNSEVLETGEDRPLHRGLDYIGGITGKRKKWLDDGKDNSRNFSQGQRVYSTKGISTTLAGNAGGQGGKTGLYLSNSKIRRLTPIECERLQGFPDNWTAGVSDTQRYKMCGNAVTVNVVNYLVSKL